MQRTRASIAKPGQVRLARALSKLGIASRGQAHDWIRAGKVTVDGEIRRNPRLLIVPERTRIEIEGKRVVRAEPCTLLLHKPRGMIVSRSDEKGRATVFSLLKETSFSRVHLTAVGRLDWATSGLLILTNDTRLANWLTDPVNQVRRTYLVSVRGEITLQKLELLRRGIRDQGELLQARQLLLRKASGRESHLVVGLLEGKNREVRRLFAAIGHEVTRLKRVAYGPLELGELQPGEFRELGMEELRSAFPDAPMMGSVKNQAPGEELKGRSGLAPRF